jgi:predicted RNA-binding protein associated with RNAse of E/G family
MQICSASSSNDEAQDRNAPRLGSHSAIQVCRQHHRRRELSGHRTHGAEYPDHDSLCVLADGYSWLRCFPQSPHHIMTFMFDADGHVLQLWVDVCLDHGIDAAGLSWWDDLYLDIVVLPDGYLEMQNADELADALADRSITQV